MSDPKSIPDAILKFMDNSDLSSLDGANTLLADIAKITEGAIDQAAAAGVAPDQLDQLKAAMKDLATMQGMIAEVDAAQAAGDWEEALALSQDVAKLGGVDLTPESYDPPYDALMAAIEDDDVQALRQVLETQSPDLNVQLGRYDTTPLLRLLGSENRTAEKVALLLKHGARADMTSSDGFSPLHAIADYMWRYEYDPKTDVAIAQLLVKQGADLEARDSYGMTPLLRAITCGVTGEVAALLEVGADPNTSYPSEALPAFNAGRPALTAACSDPDATAILLKHGADIGRKAANGKDVFAEIDRLLDDDHSDYPEFEEKLRATREILRAQMS